MSQGDLTQGNLTYYRPVYLLQPSWKLTRDKQADRPRKRLHTKVKLLKPKIFKITFNMGLHFFNLILNLYVHLRTSMSTLSVSFLPPSPSAWLHLLPSICWWLSNPDISLHLFLSIQSYKKNAWVSPWLLLLPPLPIYLVITYNVELTLEQWRRWTANPPYGR